MLLFRVGLGVGLDGDVEVEVFDPNLKMSAVPNKEPEDNLR